MLYNSIFTIFSGFLTGYSRPYQSGVTVFPPAAGNFRDDGLKTFFLEFFFIFLKKTLAIIILMLYYIHLWSWRIGEMFWRTSGLL
jgi:hypothetical protein